MKANDPQNEIHELKEHIHFYETAGFAALPATFLIDTFEPL